MKDKKEWADQIDHLPLFSHDSSKAEKAKLEFVAAIQLDAWRQGMSYAAKIAGGGKGQQIIEAREFAHSV